MKNLIITAMLLMLFTACSSDDNNNEIEDPVSERIEYEFSSETEIPNGNGEDISVTIPVSQDMIIIDPTKVFLEITLDHYKASDITCGYILPNETIYRRIFANLGGNNNFDRNNVLSFNPNHTDVISTTADYPGGIIPAGNYKEGSYSTTLNPVETPLFHNMINKNIKGNWRFFFEDYQDDISLDDGSLVKIKLIFDEGALQVNEN